MNFLESWVAAPLAGALGWTLLHSLWQGAVPAALLAAALLAIRSPRVRYAAACLAMLLMLIGFGVTLFRMMPQGSGLTIQRTPRSPAWNVPLIGDTRNSWNPDLAAIAPWLAPFWMAGVVFLYLRNVAGFMTLRRLRRQGVCSAPESWQTRLRHLSARLRLSKPVLLLESSLADTPLVLGYLRPLILMPVGLLAGLPVAQVEAILLHELAHIRRRDYLVNILQRLVEGLLFYHPAVWWISRVIRAEREHCSDDIAVSISGDAHDYAVALAALEQNRGSGREPALAATGGTLVKRIRRLLYPSKSNGAWTPFLAALILIAAGAITVAVVQAGPRPQNSTAGQPRQTSPYFKWLTEDVAYIIDDSERTAFLKLTTDAERAKFVEQFWLRRDPTPGTPENEFKEEHYRRLAYANNRFSSSVPGWQTDRGHIYISYGPPDEIETHPRGTQTEVWMYRHLDGIGDDVTITFIDRTGRGDYRIAPGNGVTR